MKPILIELNSKEEIEHELKEKTKVFQEILNNLNRLKTLVNYNKLDELSKSFIEEPIMLCEKEINLIKYEIKV